MKNYLLYFLFFITLFFSCQNKYEKNDFKINLLIKKNDSLELRIDSLKQELKKCDDWVNYLEAE